MMECTGCRLCLEIVTEKKLVSFEEPHKNMLQMVIPVINWSNAIYGQANKICQECSENLLATSLFKSSCLNKNKKVKILEEVSVTLRETLEVTSRTCFFCQGSDVFEDSIDGDDVNLKEIVHRCFPQLSLSSLYNLDSCKQCWNSLQDLNSFINKCLNTEECVKNYCSTMGITQKDFSVDDYIKHKNPSAISTDNGVEPGDANFSSISEGTETTALENNSNSEHAQKSNGMDISQDEADMEQDIDNSKENAIERIKLPEGSSDQINKSEDKDSRFGGKFPCEKCDYVAKHKSALVSHMVRHMDPTTTKMHKCEVCGHETKRIADLRWHMIIHRDPKDVKMYHCANCPYETKRKGDLKQHMVIHKPQTIKCTLCTFETKYEKYLTIHMLVHKDKSEVKTYKCESCSYEAKTKFCLYHHSRIHKDPSKREKFKCNWCNFETHYKQSVLDHQKVHKCKSELPKSFKCYSCGYEATKKCHLVEHMTRHTVNPVTYDCSKCSYKGKLERYLRRHMDTHKDPSEIRRFQCEMCTYEVARKGNLKAHMYSHFKNLPASKNKQQEIKKIMLKIDNMR